MPRILYVLNDAGYFLSHRLPVAKAASRAGFEVHVATPPGPAVPAIEDRGYRFHPIPLSRRGMNVWQELASVLALRTLYRRVQPDIVHHLTVKPILYGGAVSRVAGHAAVVNAVPGLGHIFTASGPRASILRRLVLPAYRFALRNPLQRTIFQNHDDEEKFRSLDLTSPGRSVVILGSGVNVGAFAPSPEPEGPPTVVLASRMLKAKGIEDFVEAARELRARQLDARFVLAGDSDSGNPGAIPRHRLHAWHNEGIVEWRGWQDDMVSVYANAHIVCLPSYYGEGVPKALIEAAACGRPIVTTDTPGCREIVGHEENGLLVPPRNARLLADAIQRLVESPELRSKFGRAGRERVLTRFSETIVIERTLLVYEALLQERRYRTGHGSGGAT